MPASLIERLNIGQAVVGRMRFDKQTVRVSLSDVTERELTKPTKNGADWIVTIVHSIEESLESMDGRKLSPGRTLKEDIWVNSKDPESIANLESRLKKCYLTYKGLPLNSEVDIGTEELKAAKGCEMNLYLSYAPSKENPSDPELGFQNFAYHALADTKAAPVKKPAAKKR